MEDGAVLKDRAPVAYIPREVRELYDEERTRGTVASAEGRRHRNAVAAHDVAVALGISTGEVADYVEKAGGERPDTGLL